MSGAVSAGWVPSLREQLPISPHNAALGLRFQKPPLFVHAVSDPVHQQHIADSVGERCVPGGGQRREEGLVDPWQLAPKVGLQVMDGETPLALLPEEDRLHLCGPASRSWSGGVLPLPLPDGSRLCILNPRHQKRRNKVTLMEEITHSFLNHKPTKITLGGGMVEVRDFDASEKRKPTVRVQQR